MSKYTNMGTQKVFTAPDITTNYAEVRKKGVMHSLSDEGVLLTPKYTKRWWRIHCLMKEFYYLAQKDRLL